MQIRTFLLIVMLGAVGAVAAMNWTAFNTPTTLWVGVTSVEAPIGTVMLGAVAVLTLFFLLSIGYMQSLALLEASRHAKELQTSQELAEQAEVSRFTELRRFMETQVQSLSGADVETRAVVLARLNQLDAHIAMAIEQNGNSLAASIGEMEDRLERNGMVLADR